MTNVPEASKSSTSWNIALRMAAIFSIVEFDNWFSCSFRFAATPLPFLFRQLQGTFSLIQFFKRQLVRHQGAGQPGGQFKRFPGDLSAGGLLQDRVAQQRDHGCRLGRRIVFEKLLQASDSAFDRENSDHRFSIFWRCPQWRKKTLSLAVEHSSPCCCSQCSISG